MWFSPASLERVMPERIWTFEARRLLYQRLVKKFGPYSKWNSGSSPGRNLDEDFQRFCEAFALVVGAESAEAVKIQIRFAMPESTAGSLLRDGQAQTAILNKAAAFDAEFIQNQHLPDLRAVGRGVALDDLI
jgi:hypothetical protein